MAKHSTLKDDWQVTKTLNECLGHMLEEKIACDVTFQIHSPDGTVTKISAHKFMLRARSPVFEAMFSGSYIESDNEVKITDIEVGVFKEMLRYMYTDAGNVTEDNAIGLIYAARKYMMYKLENVCVLYLETIFTDLNICTILAESLTYDYEQLTAKCQNYVVKNAQQIIKSEGFLNSKLDLLLRLVKDYSFFATERIISDENLDFHIYSRTSSYIRRANRTHSGLAAEADLFDACIEWANRHVEDVESEDEKQITVDAESSEGNSLSKDIENSGEMTHAAKIETHDQKLRKVLEECLHQIRFTLMTAEQFAIRVNNSSLLTDQEKSLILCYLLTRDDYNKARLTRMGFNMSSRLTKCDRYRNIQKCTALTKSNLTEIFTFSVSKAIAIIGFSVFPESHHSMSVLIDVQVSQPKNDVKIFKTISTIAADADGEPVHVCLPKAIHIDSYDKVKVSVTVNGQTLYGADAHKETTMAGVAFSMEVQQWPATVTQKRMQSGMTFRGQVPEILFAVL